MADIQIKPSIGEITPTEKLQNKQDFEKEISKLRETTIEGMIKLNYKIDELTKNFSKEIKEIKDKVQVQKDYTILQSEQIDKISAALSKAQGMFKIASKSNTGKGTSDSFKFAGMDDLVSATKEGLEANGLCVVQRIAYDFNEQFYYFCTQLSHSSGQWFRASFLLTPDDGNFMKGNIKSVQSATTKMNRYAYRDILCIGVNEEEEEDGNKQKKEEKPEPAKKEEPKKTNQFQEIPNKKGNPGSY